MSVLSSNRGVDCFSDAPAAVDGRNFTRTARPVHLAFASADQLAVDVQHKWTEQLRVEAGELVVGHDR